MSGLEAIIKKCKVVDAKLNKYRDITPKNKGELKIFHAGQLLFQAQLELAETMNSYIEELRRIKK